MGRTGGERKDTDKYKCISVNKVIEETSSIIFMELSKLEEEEGGGEKILKLLKYVDNCIIYFLAHPPNCTQTSSFPSDIYRDITTPTTLSALVDMWRDGRYIEQEKQEPLYLYSIYRLLRVYMIDLYTSILILNQVEERVPTLYYAGSAHMTNIVHMFNIFDIKFKGGINDAPRQALQRLWDMTVSYPPATQEERERAEDDISNNLYVDIANKYLDAFDV